MDRNLGLVDMTRRVRRVRVRDVRVSRFRIRVLMAALLVGSAAPAADWVPFSVKSVGASEHDKWWIDRDSIGFTGKHRSAWIKLETLGSSGERDVVLTYFTADCERKQAGVTDIITYENGKQINRRLFPLELNPVPPGDPIAGWQEFVMLKLCSFWHFF